MRKYGYATLILLMATMMSLCFCVRLSVEHGNLYALGLSAGLLILLIVFSIDIGAWAADKDFPPK